MHSPEVADTKEMPPVSAALESLIASYERWLHLPDVAPLLVVLGTVAGNRLPGDPIWTFVLGAPSSGKTEIVTPLAGLPESRFVDAFTGPALLTAGRHGEIGGILPSFERSGTFGLLVAADFSTFLAGGGHEALAERFAVMRRIFDGSFDRYLGSRGGQRLAWSGKAGLVAAVTDQIDRHHADMAALGARFVYIRQPALDAKALAVVQERASGNVGTQEVMRFELKAATGDFFERLALPERPERVTNPTALHALTRLVTRARSHVERSGQVITWVPQPEYPMRLGAQLSQLYGGLRAIGVEAAYAFELVERVAVDSVPPDRYRSLATVVTSGCAMSTEEVAEEAGIVPGLAEVALGDLMAHGLVRRDAALLWTPTELCLSEWDKATGGRVDD